MSYDLYVEKPQGDVVTQLRLLVTEPNSANVARQFVQFVHGKASQFNNFIDQKCKHLKSSGLLPTPPDIALLPPGSWFLQFTFTLARPWISKDDDPFYVAESVNPVRKDKVFKVPTMSAASWKGLLRWMVMHIRLAMQKDKLTADEFARERLAQTLLFGDEKGEEPGQTKDFAAYLGALKPEARQDYERLLRAHYKLSSADPLPHHSGRLMFYPTFFNRIDVEVINPHSRKTRAGTHPIYLECVPIGAQGTFSLLYVPFDLIGKEERDIKQQSLADLELIAEGLSAMFLTYGFSAKRTSGYGVAEETVSNGLVQIREVEPEKPETQKPTWLKHKFDSFAKLKKEVTELLAKQAGAQ
jgi:CRISPR-associated protein Cmr2